LSEAKLQRETSLPVQHRARLLKFFFVNATLDFEAGKPLWRHFSGILAVFRRKQEKAYKSRIKAARRLSNLADFYFSEGKYKIIWGMKKAGRKRLA